MFNKIGIVGLGVIGASTAALIREKYPETKIFGLATKKNTIDFALDQKIIDFGFTKKEDFPHDLDLIIIAAPIPFIKEYADFFLNNAEKEIIVTDTGSIKNNVFPDFKNTPTKLFIGGHPMGGSEKSGVKEANADLVRNQTYILIKEEHPLYQKFLAFLKTFDFKIVELDSALTHDKLLSAASHFPYLMAILTSLSTSQDISQPELFKEILGSGFFDTTRRASAVPNWGIDVCKYNKNNLLNELKIAKDNLILIEELIKNNEYTKLFNIFENTKNFRDALCK